MRISSLNFAAFSDYGAPLAAFVAVSSGLSDLADRQTLAWVAPTDTCREQQGQAVLNQIVAKPSGSFIALSLMEHRRSQVGCLVPVGIQFARRDGIASTP